MAVIRIDFRNNNYRKPFTTQEVEGMYIQGISVFFSSFSSVAYWVSTYQDVATHSHRLKRRECLSLCVLMMVAKPIPLSHLLAARSFIIPYHSSLLV